MRGFLSENMKESTKGFLSENVRESTKGFSWKSRTVKLRSEPLFPICWLVVSPAKISAGFWNVILLWLNRYGKASSNIDILPSTIDNAALLQNKEAFRNTYGNQEGFNMCQALDELMADKMNEGILLEKQNSEAKIRTIISNMLAGGISCENICRFLECDPSLVEQVQAGIQ